MYDYTVEMMRKYEKEEPEEWIGSYYYNKVAEGLFIVAADGTRKFVSEDIKELFRKEYEKYVEKRLRETKDPLVIFMFQGMYKPIVQRNKPRRGMIYVEDSVQQVIKLLPRLPKGERYGFPSLRIIRNEECTQAFVFPK